MKLLELSRSLDDSKVEALIAERDYEELDILIISYLIGRKMKAGFSKVKITPPIGTTMMGYGKRDMAHGCESIRDDIYVRAVFLEHSGEKALIMGFDLCFIGREETDRFKEAIGRKIDLSPKQILMNASHTHVSASVGMWYSAAYNDPDQSYLNDLEKATVAAACMAHDTADEATLWAGTVRSDLPMSRRKKLDDGTIARWQPSPHGIVYDRLPICLFRDSLGKPVCLLFSVSAHPAIMTGFEISAEYPGAAMKIIDDYLGTGGSIFLQGVGGDAETSVMFDSDSEKWQERNNPKVMDRAGEMLAEEVIDALDKGLVQIEPDIQTAAIEMVWPFDDPPPRVKFETIVANTKPENQNKNNIKYMWAVRQLNILDKGDKLPSSVTLTAQGIKIGDGLRILGLEGEPVSEWGYFIENFYGDGVTFPIGYSNGMGLYLPVSKMLPEGGYEVESYWEYGFPSPLAGNMEEIVSDALLKLRSCGIS